MTTCSVVSCSSSADPPLPNQGFPFQLADISLEFKTPSETRGLPFFASHPPPPFAAGQLLQPVWEAGQCQTQESAVSPEEPAGERVGQVLAPWAQAGQWSHSGTRANYLQRNLAEFRVIFQSFLLCLHVTGRHPQLHLIVALLSSFPRQRRSRNSGRFSNTRKTVVLRP